MHKEGSPRLICFALIAVSSSRYEKIRSGEKVEDPSGDMILNFVEAAGYKVIYAAIISDDKGQIIEAVTKVLNDPDIDVIITYGGTGISQSDVTIETLKPIFEKELTGFGELLRKISYDEIGSASILTRATAGTVKGKIIFCLPGSSQAVESAMKNLIIPEAAHITKHIREK
jgi:molybdenum cofactor biosynthesis protein B